LEKVGFVWDPLAEQWEKNFKLLQEFKKKNKHCNVPHSHQIGDVKLGHWVSNLRAAYKAYKGERGGTKICPKRAERLEEIGFQWTVEE